MFPPGLMRFPHARGDVPHVARVPPLGQQFSPRTWGCSGVVEVQDCPRSVFPTHVGCSGQTSATIFARAVFPTHVGMFRVPLLRTAKTGFPEARGDVPANKLRSWAISMFSPRTWGCSARTAGTRCAMQVFPTHVGMFRLSASMLNPTDCFPHARGDVPSIEPTLRRGNWFSPRTWGCSGDIIGAPMGAFVFPTHVGMFRAYLRILTPRLLSPRTRGCSGRKNPQ